MNELFAVVFLGVGSAGLVGSVIVGLATFRPSRAAAVMQAERQTRVDHAEQELTDTAQYMIEPET